MAPTTWYYLLHWVRNFKHRKNVLLSSISPVPIGYSANICGINKQMIYFMIETPFTPLLSPHTAHQLMDSLPDKSPPCHHKNKV